MRRFLAAAMLATALALSACGSSGTNPAPNGPIDASGVLTGPQARKAVYTISASVVALGDIAVAYKSLPRCPAPAGTFCHDAAIVAEVAKAYGAADDSLKNAEAFLKANPSGDAGDVIRLANVALATVQSLVLKYNLAR